MVFRGTKVPAYAVYCLFHCRQFRGYRNSRGIFRGVTVTNPYGNRPPISLRALSVEGLGSCAIRAYHILLLGAITPADLAMHLNLSVSDARELLESIVAAKLATSSVPEDGDGSTVYLADRGYISVGG